MIADRGNSLSFSNVLRNAGSHLQGHPDTREGIVAFVEKRRPNYTGQLEWRAWPLHEAWCAARRLGASELRVLRAAIPYQGVGSQGEASAFLLLLGVLSAECFAVG